MHAQIAWVSENLLCLFYIRHPLYCSISQCTYRLPLRFLANSTHLLLQTDSLLHIFSVYEWMEDLKSLVISVLKRWLLISLTNSQLVYSKCPTFSIFLLHCYLPFSQALSRFQSHLWAQCKHFQQVAHLCKHISFVYISLSRASMKISLLHF